MNKRLTPTWMLPKNVYPDDRLIGIRTVYNVDEE